MKFNIEVIVDIDKLKDVWAENCDRVFEAEDAVFMEMSWVAESGIDVLNIVRQVEIEAETGEGFQEYEFLDSGERVPAGTPVGYEIEGDSQIHLYPNIMFSSDGVT